MTTVVASDIVIIILNCSGKYISLKIPELKKQMLDSTVTIYRLVTLHMSHIFNNCVDMRKRT